MRLPNGSSRVGPDDRVQRHARLAGAGADLADELALERLLVELALAGDHRARGAHARRRSRARRAPTARPARARRRARPRGRRTGRRRRRSSARRAGRAGTWPRAGRAARASRTTIVGVGALLRAEDLRRRPRRPCGRRSARRAARRAGRRRRRSPPARRRRRRWSPSRRPRPGSPARRPRRRRRSAGRCRRWTRPRRRARPRRPGRARWRRPSRRSRCRRPPPARSRRATSRPSGSCTSTACSSPPSCGQQRVERALAAVGDRAQVGRHQPGALEPAADRPGDLRSAERALEGVRGDEDGALGDGHRRHRFRRP